MAISKEQIFQVADDMSAAGQDPTLAAVRKALGGGSFTTISEAMKEWRASRQAAEVQFKEPPPALITERLEELGAEVWAVATEAAGGRLQAEREALEKVRAEMEKQQAEAAEMADQMNAEIEQLKSRVFELDTNLGQLHHQLKQAEQQTKAAEARSTEQEKRIADIRDELKQAQRKLDEAERRERAATTTAGELESAGAGLRAEVKALEKAGAELEKRLSAQAAELEAAKRQTGELTADLKQANQQAEREAHRADTAAQDAAATREALEQDRAQFTAEAEKRQTAEARYGEQEKRVNDMKDEIAALSAKLAEAEQREREYLQAAAKPKAPARKPATRRKKADAPQDEEQS